MNGRRDWVGERQGKPQFEFDLLAIEIGEQICQRLDELGLNRADLARRMGVTPARVTQVLAGSDNLTLKTLVAVAHALDAEVAFTLKPRTGAGVRPVAAHWVDFGKYPARLGSQAGHQSLRLAA